jgi:hypothetical protein
MKWHRVHRVLRLWGWMLMTFSMANAQDLRVSEISWQSTSTLKDESGQVCGWVELQNTGSRKVNLNSYGFSDSPSLEDRWIFPKQSLAPGDFVVILFAGKGEGVSRPANHADFKLKLSDSLFFWRGREIIQILPPATGGGFESLGCLEHRGMELEPFAKATPGEPNQGGLLDASCIQFDVPSGIYKEGVWVLPVSPIEGYELRYTLDGTDPTGDSPLLSGAIFLDASAVSTQRSDTVRVSANGHSFFQPKETKRIVILGVALVDAQGNRRSETAFQSYHFDSQERGLTLVSLTGAWSDLYSPETGILNPGVRRDSLPAGNCSMRGREWEREVQLHLMQRGEPTQSMTVGLRTHGGSSRESQQKGLRLYARKSYGYPNVTLRLFGKIMEVDRLAMKPSTRSYSGLGIEDHLCSYMAVLLGLEAPMHRFAEVFINGVYQGVYTVHPMINEDWIRNEYGALDPVIVTGWDGTTEEGVDSSFVALMDFVTERDLSVPAHYAYVSQVIDIGNFIDYQIFEQFIANRDWPVGNVKCWRDSTPDSKWRWIFFDGDAALRFQNLNGFTHALGHIQCKWCRTGGDASVLLKKLWANPEFRSMFLARAESLKTTLFAPETTLPWFNAVWGQIEPSLPDQINRFNHITMEQAQAQRELLKKFLTTQPALYWSFLEKGRDGLPPSMRTASKK